MVRLEAGDRLLVAVCPDRVLLVAYPMPVLDAMILTYHNRQSRQDVS